MNSDSNEEEVNRLNLNNAQKVRYRAQLRRANTAERRRNIVENARRAVARAGAREERRRQVANVAEGAVRTMAGMGTRGLANMWSIFDTAFEKLDGKLVLITVLAAINHYFGEKALNKLIPNLTNVASPDIVRLMKDDKIIGRIEKFKIYFKPGYKSVDAFTTALLFMVLLRSVVIWKEKSTKVKAMLRWVFSQKLAEMAFGAVSYRVCVWAAVQTFFDIAKILLTGTEYKSEYKILKNSDAFTKLLVYLKIVSERTVGVTTVNIAFNKFRKLSQGVVVRTIANMLGWVMDLPIIGPIGRDAILGTLTSIPLRRMLAPPNNSDSNNNNNKAPQANGGRAPANLNSARRTTRQVVLTATNGTAYRFQNQRDIENLQFYNGGAMGSTDTILTNSAGVRYRVTANQLRAAERLRTAARRTSMAAVRRIQNNSGPASRTRRASTPNYRFETPSPQGSPSRTRPRQ